MMKSLDIDASHGPAVSTQADKLAVRRLILWQVPTQGGSNLVQFVQELLAGTEGAAELTSVKQLSEAREHLHAASNARLLLLYESPVLALCAAMTEEISPGVALGNWIGTAEDILRIVRSHRRRVTLVDAHMIARHPKAFIRQVGLTRRARQIPAPPRPDEASDDPILQLIAAEALRQDFAALAIAGELEASAIDLSDGAPRSDVDPQEAFVRYRDELKSKAKVEAAKAALRRIRSLKTYRMMKPFRRLYAAWIRRWRANG
jgi:hypothetical protein